MSLRSRLLALERAVKEADLLAGPAPCPTCGTPDPGASRMIVVNLSKGESLSHCPACSRPLAESGRPLPADHDVIFLNYARADVPLPG